MPAANPEVEFHLDGFVAKCSEMLKEYYGSRYKGKLSPPEVEVSEGGKYYKVIQTSERNQRAAQHVWFFVDKEEGNIWKAATWKAPAKNFPRGNIIQDHPKDVIGIHGL